MKTLRSYIVRQMLATLLMTVVVFTFVLLLGNVLKQVLDLIVGGQVSVRLVAEAILLLIPYVWSFALPVGMLTASLLVFGRFSADNELTAVRASGISLISLVSPVLVLSLVLCGLSAWVNMDIAPRCRVAHKSIISRAKDRMLDSKSGISVASLLPEGRYIKDIPGYIIYVEKNRGGVIEGVTVMGLPNKSNVTYSVLAPRGEIRLDAISQQLNLKLFDAQIINFTENNNLVLADGEVYEAAIDLRSTPKSTGKANISNMTFRELQEELQDVERRIALEPPSNLPPAQAGDWAKRTQKLRDKVTSPIRVLMHRQLATSFACFGFTLIGIPLGIRVHRRETNIGFVVALVLVVIFYGLLGIGMGMDTRPEFFPHLIVWLPTFLFQAVGAVLLWRANRGV